MGEREAFFIRAICEQPDDDAARLVYADWLDEHGEPERAEFIRAGVEAAGCRACEGEGYLRGLDTPAREPGRKHDRPCGDCAAARGRGRELFGQHAFGWLEEMQSGHLLLSPYAIGEGGHKPYASVGWAVGLERSPDGYYSPRAVVAAFRRGFVEELTCTAGDWLAHADALTAQHPVRKVTLTTWAERDRDSLFPGVFPDYRAVESVFAEYAARTDADGRPVYTPDHVVWADILGRAWPGVAFAVPAG